MQAISSILGPRNQQKESSPRNPRKVTGKTQRNTDNMAEYLVQKFGSPEHRPIFLRAAWRLDDATISRYVAMAFDLGKNPRAYFITLVKKDRRYCE